MSLLKTLIVGRENGIRRGLVRTLMGGGSSSQPAQEVSPSSGSWGPEAPAPPSPVAERAETPVEDLRSGNPDFDLDTLPRHPNHASHAVAEAMGPQVPEGVEAPEGYTVVLHKDALIEGEVTEVTVGETAIAVTRIEDKYYACGALCPHADGPLSEGHAEDGTITCPFHGWEFDLSNGNCKTVPNTSVPVYPVEIVGDAICVAV